MCARSRDLLDSCQDDPLHSIRVIGVTYSKGMITISY